MIFSETKLPGVFIVDIQKLEDERGFFARTWCKRTFAERGLSFDLAQCSVSFNRKRGTLRGMHYQTEPCAEAKLVSCTAGAIYDVVLDLRPDSPTFTEWIAVELSAGNCRMVYVPENCAHGFQTLEDNTTIAYQISEFYAPEYSKGVRWNDPAFKIEWPEANRIISSRDAAYPDFVPAKSPQWK